ncbi:hypothetical protein TELCIR_05853 [Teladorsagia circumcincta]|uniref:Aquaporin n=1 Tax=Teladorsagia circumcincta TaxID=45464 RepID=A0A2G9UPL0_TELCI|nr:hypothetical protein TELCIR_05853 [Teladorsagia circumcincta]
MVKHYGPMAFFFTVTSLLTVGSFVNRGAFVSPLAPIEAFLYGIIGFALIYVGVPGLNPVVASSRLFGCEGMDTQWFIAVYWICPIFGWMAAAALEKSMAKRAPKKLKKKSN